MPRASTARHPASGSSLGRLVDAGADIVVGSHTHRVMTAGRLGPALVDYGLGNFVFYNESGASGVTGVLTVTATGRDVDAYTWKPARIRGGIPQLLTGDAAAPGRRPRSTPAAPAPTSRPSARPQLVNGVVRP